MKEGFIRRDYYLNLLDSNTASFKKGAGKNIALLGPRKSGKTFIVKEHIKNAKDVISVYIDLEKISLNPENFSVEFIGNVMFQFLKKPLSEYKDFLAIENLLKLSGQIKSPKAFDLLKLVENELLKIKPDQKLLVQTAFNFAQALGAENNRKFLIVLDNFENLLDLNNFPQIKDVLAAINFDAVNVSYIATSSAVRQSLSLLKKFECYEIKNLDRKETFDLVESFFGKNAANIEKISSEIFSLSHGHPFVTAAICRKYNETKNARKAFLVELLSKDHSVYNHCKDSLEYYYSRARGQTLLKTILKVIANDELRLSEIAKKIYRSAPVTKSILERLMDVDIIYRKDNRFYFSDNALKLWIKFVSSGYEFDDIPDDKILDEVAKGL
mgnify:CR=1 FL=1